MKCDNCWQKLNKDFNGEFSRTNWLKLMDYFEHQRNEEEISDATYQTMTDALMCLKPYIEDPIDVSTITDEEWDRIALDYYDKCMSKSQIKRIHFAQYLRELWELKDA